MPPKNDFVRAGRYDLARCVERWGGLYEVRGQRPEPGRRRAEGAGLLMGRAAVECSCLCHAFSSSPRPRPPSPPPPCLLPQLAAELGYEVSGSSTRRATEWQSHISEVAANTGLSGREGLFELAARTYAERRSLASSDLSDDDEQQQQQAPGSSSSSSKGKGRGRRSRGVDQMPSVREEIDAW